MAHLLADAQHALGGAGAVIWTLLKILETWQRDRTALHVSIVANGGACRRPCMRDEATYSVRVTISTRKHSMTSPARMSS